MNQTFSDSSTGWRFAYEAAANGQPPPGGIVLRDVRHEQHHFARELRIIGVRLRVQLIHPPDTVVKTTWHFLPLSDPPFRTTAIRLLLPETPAGPATNGKGFAFLTEAAKLQQFRTYFRDPKGNYAACGARADYVLPEDYLSKTFSNCEMQGLTVSQRMLFSRYGLVPPHEPGGVLQAARCHPAVKYFLSENPRCDHSQPFHRIASIRFDYRLHLYVDPQYDVGTTSGSPKAANQAGVFRDEEFVNPVSGLLGLRRGLSGAGSRVAFAAVEKPLILELASLGLAGGGVVLGTRRDDPRCWDNVHWWGAREPGKGLISAPGAFHAAHVHWRWGGAGSAFLRPHHPEVDTSGAPVPLQNHPDALATRTLVDPAIPLQTIRIAVTKNHAQLDPNRGVALDALSRDDWPSLFTSRSPQDIAAGDDLVLWYSSEVHRAVHFEPGGFFRSANAGTVFLHGIFFGHNAELSRFGVGSREPEYRPRDEQAIRSSGAWERHG